MSSLTGSLTKFDRRTLELLERKLQRESLKRRARQDLISFTEYTFPRYAPAPPHRIIAEQLERVERGDVDRLMLLCPPRHGKSELASRRFPAFYLGRHSHKQFISASASATLAEDFGRDVRNLIASEEYAEVFATRLSEDSQAKGRWSTQQGGSYYAVGVGSQVMGRGAHVFMIDDPFGTMQDAQSEAERKNVWDWFGGTVYNRLEEGGAIVVINHRMHEDDLSGRLLAQQAAGGDRWTVVELKATPDHPLWPEKYPEDVLRRIQLNTPARHWSALYEQNPTPDDGSFFSSDWLRPYTELPDKRTLKLYGASDYAVTEDGGDWTVHGVVGVDPEDRMYLVDLWRAQTTPDIWVESFCDMVHAWRPIGWAEESGQIKSSVGPWLARRIAERQTYVARVQFPTRGDKAVRSQSIRGRMASRGLYVPTGAQWYPAFRAELLSFPVGKHDDQVDMLGLIGQIIDKMGVGSKLPEATPLKIISTEAGKTTVTLSDMFDANERKGRGPRSRIR